MCGLIGASEDVCADKTAQGDCWPHGCSNSNQVTCPAQKKLRMNKHALPEGVAEQGHKLKACINMNMDIFIDHCTEQGQSTFWSFVCMYVYRHFFQAQFQLAIQASAELRLAILSMSTPPQFGPSLFAIWVCFYWTVSVVCANQSERGYTARKLCSLFAFLISNEHNLV